MFSHFGIVTDSGYAISSTDNHDFPKVLAINGGLIPFEATKQLKVENVEEVGIVYIRKNFILRNS